MLATKTVRNDYYYSCTLLNHFYVSSEEFITKSEVLDAHFTDHRLISIQLAYEQHQVKQRLLIYRDFSSFSYQEFLTDFIEWMLFYQPNCINYKVNFLNEYLLSTFNIHAPIKTIRISKPASPWLTDTLKD